MAQLNNILVAVASHSSNATVESGSSPPCWRRARAVLARWLRRLVPRWPRSSGRRPMPSADPAALIRRCKRIPAHNGPSAGRAGPGRPWPALAGPMSGEPLIERATFDSPGARGLGGLDGLDGLEAAPQRGTDHRKHTTGAYNHTQRE